MAQLTYRINPFRRYKSATLHKPISPALRALRWEGVLCEPLAFMIHLLPFIMVKELSASENMIAVYVALKPVSALFSVYCVQLFAPAFTRYYLYLIVSGVLARLLFCMFPMYFLVGDYDLLNYGVLSSMAIYMMLYRSAMPLWNELLRRKVPSKTQRASFLSFSSTSGYIFGVALSFSIGAIMQRYPHVWGYLFLGSALIGMIFVYLQSQIPKIPEHIADTKGDTQSKNDSLPVGHKQLFYILKPIKEAVAVLKQRPDFLNFQVGFTLCGASIMMIYAVMAHFFVEKLQVSYSQIALAIACFRALGYFFTSRFWAYLLAEKEHNSERHIHPNSEKSVSNTNNGFASREVPSFFSTSRIVFCAVALFPLFLLLASLWPSWRLLCVYTAFFFYGTGLAGNHLVWHLSPAAFSNEKGDCSTIYSRVHLLAVGVRGLIFPQVGLLLSWLIGVEGVLLVSVLLSVSAALWMQIFAPKAETTLTTPMAKAKGFLIH